jgi:hypothetical protein
MARTLAARRHMYPPPHMPHMYPPPHMTHMYPPPRMTHALLQRTGERPEP